MGCSNADDGVATLHAKRTPLVIVLKMRKPMDLLSRLDSNRTLCTLYALFALLQGLFLIWATPPFQTPDAIAHFDRAIQISRGSLFGERFDNTSGGAVDISAIQFSDIYSEIPFHPEIKATSDMRQRSEQLRWSDSTRNVNFPNTSIYPAYTYLPQSAVIAVGRALGARIYDVYIAVCVLDLLISLCITVWSISVARRIAPLLFALGLLPSTLMIFSSVSQEVTILPLCFLLAAYIDRFSAEALPLRVRWQCALVGVLAVCASARPPYAGLLLILFVPALMMDDSGAYRFGRRLMIFLIASTMSITAVVAFGYRAWSNFGPEHSVTGQLDYLLHTPSAVISIALGTFRVQGAFYFSSFVGILGWLDTFLGVRYYKAACLMLMAALATIALTEPVLGPSAVRRRAALVVPVIASAAMIFGSLYLAWTPVAKSSVDGVQGRYFLALLPLLAIAIPAVGWRKWPGLRARLGHVFTLCIVLFPCYSFVRLTETIIERFYLH